MKKLAKKKHLEEYGLKLRSVQEVGKYENGPWKITLRLSEGIVKDQLFANEQEAIGFLAYLVNELLKYPAGLYFMGNKTVEKQFGAGASEGTPQNQTEATSGKAPAAKEEQPTAGAVSVPASPEEKENV